MYAVLATVGIYFARYIFSQAELVVRSFIYDRLRSLSYHMCSERRAYLFL